MAEILTLKPTRPYHVSDNVLTPTSATRSLKALATEHLQKNKCRNKGETTTLISIPPYDMGETNSVAKFAKQIDVSRSSSLKDDFEERIAIAQYDGEQDAIHAQRIAYEGAIMTILNDNPPNDLVRPNADWLMDRIRSAEGYLRTQGIRRPG